MTQLVWNAAGARLFEAGVDRAVLYPRSSGGVAWNGLKSVNQKPSGGKVTGLYNDGVRFHNLQSNSEFAGNLEAYTYPDEFERCDGTYYLDMGLGLGEQEREEFDLSYRTGIGNDLLGLDFGYKIHLIYNATVEPITRKFSSTSSNVDPSVFTWEFATVPVSISGYRPTAHVTFDSRRMSHQGLKALEDLLYGTSATAARCPSPAELIELLSSLPDSYRIDSDAISGLSPLVLSVDPQDVYATDGSGTYNQTVTTRLSGTTNDGLYVVRS